MISTARSRIALLLGGAAAALVAGLAVAWVLSASHRGEPVAAPPASKGGLVIDSSGQPEAGVNGTKPLRCFVAGKFVGEFALAECARQNGVATDALDVGVDQTGALAASQQGQAVVIPLPPAQAAATAETAAAPASSDASAPAAPCWRYEGGWRKAPADMSLAACVQALFAGRCEKPGGASYGRWGQQTLRLAPGRVEISSDNRVFRLLVEQGPGCSLPAAG